MQIRRVTIRLRDDWTPPASVLFVSDDPDLCAASSRILGEAGFDVVTARHGGHALLACLRRPIDIAVLAELPDENVSAIGHRLRRRRPALQVVRVDGRLKGTSAAERLLEAVRSATSSPAF